MALNLGGVLVSSLISYVVGYYVPPIFIFGIGFDLLMIWEILRKGGAKWAHRVLPRRSWPALFALSIFVLGVGTTKVTDPILASNFSVPTFRPVFVWHSTMFAGKILAVDVPRTGVHGGVILEMLLISATSLGNESFAVSGTTYPVRQQFDLMIYNASAELPLVKEYPSITLQGELVCLQGDCINPVGNQL